MLKDEHKEVQWSETNIPYTNTRLILAVFGAVPCIMEKPYIPSRDFKTSTFLYCIIFYGVTSLSTSAVYITMLDIMEESYPYDHYKYILAVEMILGLIPNILTLICWTDTGKLFSLMRAWNTFMIKFQQVVKRPIPNCRSNEKIVNILIILSSSLIFPLSRFVTPPQYLDWKFVPAIVCSNIIQLSLAHHWIGYNMTLAVISEDISKHLKKCTNNHQISAQLVVDFKHLWLLLRNITDKMALLRTPMYLALVQCFVAMFVLFQGWLFYYHTGELLVPFVDVMASSFYLLPITFLCWTSHTATAKMEYMFEDAFSEFDLAALSDGAQKELFMIYLIKRSRKAVLTLFGFHTLSQPLLAKIIASILMYVLIFVQFHHMRSSFE